MKAFATDKTRTRRSMKIESAIEVLSEILGSRDEVIAVISEMLIVNFRRIREGRSLKRSKNYMAMM